MRSNPLSTEVLKAFFRPVRGSKIRALGTNGLRPVAESWGAVLRGLGEGLVKFGFSDLAHIITTLTPHGGLE